MGSNFQKKIQNDIIIKTSSKTRLFTGHAFNAYSLKKQDYVYSRVISVPYRRRSIKMENAF